MPKAFRESLLELRSEAYTGPNHVYTWFVGNEPGSGLLGTLQKLTAEETSRAGPSRTTVAAHTEHLRWSLAHANAFAPPCVRSTTPCSRRSANRTASQT